MPTWISRPPLASALRRCEGNSSRCPSAMSAATVIRLRSRSASAGSFQIFGYSVSSTNAASFGVNARAASRGLLKFAWDMTASVSNLADELVGEIEPDAFGTAFRAMAAFLHAAERQLRRDNAVLVDADHAGFEPVRHIDRGARVARECVG